MLASVAGMPASHGEAPRISGETWWMRRVSCRRRSKSSSFQKTFGRGASCQDFHFRNVFPAPSRICRVAPTLPHFLTPTTTTPSRSRIARCTLRINHGSNDASRLFGKLIFVLVMFGRTQAFLRFSPSNYNCLHSTLPETADRELKAFALQGPRCSMAPGT